MHTRVLSGRVFPDRHARMARMVRKGAHTLFSFLVVAAFLYGSVPDTVRAEILFYNPLGGSKLGGLSNGSPNVFTQQAVFPVSDFTCDTLPNWTIDEIDFRLGKFGLGLGEHRAALWFSSATGTPDILSTNIISIGSFEPAATRTAYFNNVNIREACRTYSTGGTSRGGRAPHLMFWGVKGISGSGHDQEYVTSNQMGALAPSVYAANSTFVADNWTFTTQVRGSIEPECTENCFSNILFLPGIKATELYEGESKRWLPGLFNFDGGRLGMDENGESVNNITVGEPMKRAYGVLEIHDVFEDFLDELKEGGTIVDWQSAPYDWRYDVYDVVARDQFMRDGSTRRLVEQVRSLAATSKTGRVTLIAHSNGGLVGKALIDALGEDADLVDRFVMVGTPQLGTPSSIPAMLHGIGQGLPIDAAPFAMSPATARALSENMPGVYGLLPLGSYVNLVSDPIVEFDDSASASSYRAAYGEGIETRDELLSFLEGGEGRTKPSVGDTLTPTILNQSMLTNTEASRNLLESWVPPVGIEVVEIVGWGLDTIRGLKYRERSCPLFSGCTFLDVEPLLTAEGDGTVVSPSADAIGSAYYLDLSMFNDANQTSWSHANVLAVSSVQDFVRDIITNTSREAPYITTTKPETSASDNRLRLSVHSPITIGIRDEEGRFTGVQPNPDASSDIPVVVQEIPNTYYLAFGEGKYVGFKSGASHEVVMSGTGTGTFTLEIDEVVDDEVVDTATYSDIPVATTTIAILTITDITNKSVLAIDEDGDGSVDDLTNPDGEAPPIVELFALLKEKIAALPLKEGLERALLNRIAKLEKKILKKGITPQITKQLKALLKFIAHKAKQGKISDAEAQSINKLIDQLDGGL